MITVISSRLLQKQECEKQKHKPTISPQPTHIPQRPVNRLADRNSFVCPTDVMKTALQNDNSKPTVHTTIHNNDDRF